MRHVFTVNIMLAVFILLSIMATFKVAMTNVCERLTESEHFFLAKKASTSSLPTQFPKLCAT